MSLKAFHIVFIILSTTLCLGFGAWGIREYALEGAPGPLALGAASILGAVALSIYGFWFLRKLKHVGYL